MLNFSVDVFVLVLNIPYRVSFFVRCTEIYSTELYKYIFYAMEHQQYTLAPVINPVSSYNSCSPHLSESRTPLDMTCLEICTSELFY